MVISCKNTYGYLNVASLCTTLFLNCENLLMICSRKRTCLSSGAMSDSANVFYKPTYQVLAHLVNMAKEAILHGMLAPLIQINGSKAHRTILGADSFGKRSYLKVKPMWNQSFSGYCQRSPLQYSPVCLFPIDFYQRS